MVLHKNAVAQYVPGKYDTIPAYCIPYNGDTIPFFYLNPHVVYGKAPAWLVARWKQQRDAYNKDYQILRYNAKKVYPYAVLASYTIRDIDSVLASMYSKDAKRGYKDRRERELNNRFKEELKDFSITQGEVLIKLVSRQTGKNVYDIVKSLKGGMNALVFQGMAKMVGNSLKEEYEPNGRDADLEAIIREIEASGNYQRVK